MGRWVALLLLMVSAGCTDGDAPPVLVQDLGASVATDMPGGGVGSRCSTACDCTAGLACQMGACTAASVMVFCCGTASCTGTSLCEFSDGTFSQCDRADGGVRPPGDAGTATACQMTSCTKGPGGNAFCKVACGISTATCVEAGGMDHCMP
jgi:hypothetical protein